jgi:hypothetical protein
VSPCTSRRCPGRASYAGKQLSRLPHLFLYVELIGVSFYLAWLLSTPACQARFGSPLLRSFPPLGELLPDSAAKGRGF